MVTNISGGITQDYNNVIWDKRKWGEKEGQVMEHILQKHDRIQR